MALVQLISTEESIDEGSRTWPSLDDVDEAYQIAMFAAFLFGLIVTCGFVVCERAPCHASPWHEGNFMAVVALCLLLVCCVTYFAVWESLPTDVRIKDSFIIFVYLMQHFLDSPVSEIRRYKGPQPASRVKAAEHFAHAITIAMHQVDAPLRCLPVLSSQRETPPILRHALPVLMLMLLMRLTVRPFGFLCYFIGFFLWAGVGLIVFVWTANWLHYCLKTRRHMAELLSLVSQTVDDELANSVLPLLHCPRLFQQIGDSRFLSDFCRGVCQQADAYGKAALVDALAKNGLSCHLFPRSRLRQRIVLEIFECTHGHELTKLKNHLDMSGDIFNLVFIFNQLSTQNRLRLLRHLAAEAAKIDVEGCHRKVLSDIDDTLFCGGHFPGGCDRRWPRKELYPGVLAFYRSLDLYHMSPNHDSEQTLVVMPKDGRGRTYIEAVARKARAHKEGVGEAPSVRPRKYGHLVGRPLGTPMTSLGLRSVDGGTSGGLDISWHDSPTSPQDSCKSIGHVPLAPKDEVNIIVSGNVGLNLADVLCVADAQAAGDAQEIPNERARNPILCKVHTVNESNVVFLSARPHVYKDVSEAVSYRVFQRLVQERRLHTMPSLLPGTIWPGMQGFLCGMCTQRAWSAAGRRKYDTFLTFTHLYPEYEFVFVGDNGQGDVLAAEAMMDAGLRVRACFIHEVWPIENTLTSLPKPDRDAWARKNIFFFQTYVGAAVVAREAGLIMAEDLAEVVSEALEDFEMTMQAHLLSSKKTGNGMPNTEKMQDALNADVDTANAVLHQDGMTQLRLDTPCSPLRACHAKSMPNLVTSHSAPAGFLAPFSLASQSSLARPPTPVCAAGSACDPLGDGERRGEQSFLTKQPLACIPTKDSPPIQDDMEREGMQMTGAVERPLEHYLTPGFA